MGLLDNNDLTKLPGLLDMQELIVDDLFSIMVLAAVLQVFHGLWVSCGRGSGGVDGGSSGSSDGDGSDAAVAGRQRQRHSGGGDDGSGSDGRESPVHS